MSDATSQTVYFYNRHPISCEIILTKLRASRGHLDGLRPEELFPHDQDHYGGLAATDELARGAQVSNGSRVADFCAGLGGTVRYLAHKYGADVTGIELTPARVSGAQELTRRVGLHGTARIVEGNVMDVPLPNASIDAVVSAQLMWEGMAIQPLRSIPEYRSLVESVGLRVISTKDLTEEWVPILKERLAMYQLLREEARQAGTPMGHDAFHKSYIRFVALIQERKMGGVRMVATK